MTPELKSRFVSQMTYLKFRRQGFTAQELAKQQASQTVHDLKYSDIKISLLQQTLERMDPFRAAKPQTQMLAKQIEVLKKQELLNQLNEAKKELKQQEKTGELLKIQFTRLETVLQSMPNPYQEYYCSKWTT